MTVKHNLAYNLEVDLDDTDPADFCGDPKNTGGPCTLPNTRHSFNAHVSKADIAESYAPPFKQATAAGAGAIM